MRVAAGLVYNVAERRPWKASDIDDESFLAAVDDAAASGPCAGNEVPWAMSDDVAGLLELPYKLVVAKADRMIRRGQLHGCGCGCRGDWHRPCRYGY